MASHNVLQHSPRTHCSFQVPVGEPGKQPRPSNVSRLSIRGMFREAAEGGLPSPAASGQPILVFRGLRCVR
jgi:hypothetical protein